MRIRVGEYCYSPGWALFVAVFLGWALLRAAYEWGVAQR